MSRPCAKGKSATEHAAVRPGTRTAGSLGRSIAKRRPSHPGVRGKHGDGQEPDVWLPDFDREEAAFRRMQPGLLQRQAGPFVAVLDGEVVDQDADELALARRVYEKYQKKRRRFVLIRSVADEDDESCHLDSPEIVNP